MKVLDIFAGLGGFSQAFAKEGNVIETMDNGKDGNFNVTYAMSANSFHPKNNGYYDVVLSGTPCTEYAKWMMRGCLFSDRSKVMFPNNELLRETIRIINEARPRIWIVENVIGAVSFISAFLGKPAIRIGRRYFWSNVHIDVKEVNHDWYKRKTLKTVKIIDKNGKSRLAGKGWVGSKKDRSKIEYDISNFFYRKFKEALLSDIMFREIILDEQKIETTMKMLLEKKK